MCGNEEDCKNLGLSKGQHGQHTIGSKTGFTFIIFGIVVSRPLFVAIHICASGASELN